MTRSKAYEVLGISSDASTEEIKAAYAELSKRYHPEEYPDEFQQVYEAYKTIKQYMKNTSKKNTFFTSEHQIDVKNNLKASVKEEPYSFVEIDKIKEKEYRRKLQEVILQLDDVYCSGDKKIDNYLLKKLLREQEDKILFNKEFIEKLILVLQEGIVTTETVNIVQLYMRPWDRLTVYELEELEELTNVIIEKREELNLVLKEKHKLFYTEHVGGIILAVFVGVLFISALLLNFVPVIRGVGFVLISGMFLCCVYFVSKRKLSESLATAISSLCGCIAMLFINVLELWKWVFDVEIVKCISYALMILCGLIFYVSITEWKKGK